MSGTVEMSFRVEGSPTVSASDDQMTDAEIGDALADDLRELILNEVDDVATDVDVSVVATARTFR